MANRVYSRVVITPGHGAVTSHRSRRPSMRIRAGVAWGNCRVCGKYPPFPGHSPPPEPEPPEHNIYVASSWRNEYQPLLVESLREAGWSVYDFRHPDADDNGFHWSDIDSDYRTWEIPQFRAALEHPLAKEGWAKDLAALERATVVVLLLPSGKSAHLEAGWAVAAGKRVYALMPDGVEGNPELTYAMFNGLCETTDELMGELQVLSATERASPPQPDTPEPIVCSPECGWCVRDMPMMASAWTCHRPCDLVTSLKQLLKSAGITLPDDDAKEPSHE